MEPGGATRLYAILARRSLRSVVFRRGPSKQVLLLSWDRTSDRFEPGQWLRGRVYERRCDLSPKGHLLVYFAAKHAGEYPIYTAISRPPFFSALALFPKRDAWGGGGLFADEKHLHLNHGPPPEMKVAPGFRLPKRFVVAPMGEWSGHGEDEPIERARRVRDGWGQVAEGKAKESRIDAPVWLKIEPPRVYARPHPQVGRIQLQERLGGIGGVGGPWYRIDFAVVVDDRDTTVIESCDWADWDRNGDLLHAKGGRIYRTTVDRKRGTMGASRELVDLRSSRFEPVEPGPGALRW